MINLGLIGAVVVMSIALAGPAMARHAVAHPAKHGKSTYCATIEPGNPYSPAYDYLAWTNWRRNGSWDSRGDNACARNPRFNGRF